ncbi:Metallo-dependent hydrolase [Lojkania enalia]|uniref:Metallo-dependent hydrolase n=1 Tax=Lojkania enalia TaxID=147567 RepID=A0A9P4KGW5_9PLEO|nr:Metallo-dependent hydrolase [Didymosphaeria enalia]
MPDDTPKKSFPWHLGVYDAHCHPTDTMSSISQIPKMKTRVLTVMATRAQDQDLIASVADSYAIKSTNQDDWQREQCIVPCFGWHPWFSHQMHIGEEEGQDQRTLTGDAKIQHYKSILKSGSDPLTDADRHAFSSLPDPTSFHGFLAQTRANLEKYPHALVGEIGLDRVFRIPEAWIPELEAQRDDQLTPGGREGRKLSPYKVDLKHQRKIFKMQLQLAAEMGRAVSIHGVRAQGGVFDTLKELYKGHERKVLSRREKKINAENKSKIETQTPQCAKKDEQQPKPYPPRICLHSYSGDSANFNQYLNPAIPVEIFASFSTAINLGDAMGNETPKAFENMIKSVPDRMLLVESDLHTAGDPMDERLENMVRRICKIKGWGLEEGVKQLGGNWKRFVFGV